MSHKISSSNLRRLIREEIKTLSERMVIDRDRPAPGPAFVKAIRAALEKVISFALTLPSISPDDGRIIGFINRDLSREIDGLYKMTSPTWSRQMWVELLAASVVSGAYAKEIDSRSGAYWPEIFEMDEDDNMLIPLPDTTSQDVSYYIQLRTSEILDMYMGDLDHH